MTPVDAGEQLPPIPVVDVPFRASHIPARALITSANEFLKTPIGKMTLDVVRDQIGFQKKIEPDKKSAVSRTLNAFSENKLVLFIVPFAVMFSLVSAIMLSFFLFKLMTLLLSRI